MPDRSPPPSSRRRPSRVAAIGGLAAVVAWRYAWRQMSRAGRSERPILADASKRQHERAATAYEPSDWTVGPVALLYAGILALLVICCFVLVVAYPLALPDADRTKHITPPGPNLQTDPAADLRQFRVNEDKRLHSYYWVDKSNGVVHIPIEQAMKKLVDTGIPGFGKGQQ